MSWSWRRNWRRRLAGRRLRVKWRECWRPWNFWSKEKNENAWIEGTFIFIICCRKVMVEAPLQTSANLIWMTSVWRLFMKVQNCLNSSSPAPSRPNRCSRMLVSTPGASSGHCPHPPAFASTNNYFALQFRAEVIHHLGGCSKDGLQAVCPRAKSPGEPEGGVFLVSSSLPPV